MAVLLFVCAGAAHSGQIYVGPIGPIAAVWANDGLSKVLQEERRGLRRQHGVINSTWNGHGVTLHGARNEVVGFNLVLETGDTAAAEISVSFPYLSGPGGFRIKGANNGREGVYRWLHRDIELFYVRYLPIRGLSRPSYEFYDERHIPTLMRRPKDPTGRYTGTWQSRPGHNKYFPEIAVPIELTPRFLIRPNQSQSIWTDIYVPPNAPPGTYTGVLRIARAGKELAFVPVQLTVWNFVLPDKPYARTMIGTSYSEIARRYTGTYPPAGSASDRLAKLVMDRQFLLAHRHKLSLVDDNDGPAPWPQNRPRPEWMPRLSGQLFTASNGYKGPGTGLGNDVFAVGMYGIWKTWWRHPNQQDFARMITAWEGWFSANFPRVERFLYLIDESTNFAQIETWAKWMKLAPKKGAMRSFATAPLPKTQILAPSLDITASVLGVGDFGLWRSAYNRLRSNPNKRLFMYNGRRPASGSFAIEDEGVALRELAWGQYKMRVDRWFYWASTYYENIHYGRGVTDLFGDAQTFGGSTHYDPLYGVIGENSANGDGVLFYPGIDAAFPDRSYDLAGPIASLRLKYWRRGIQDVDYIVLAGRKNPQRTAAIVQRMVPKALWEYGVSDPRDPTWVWGPVSWSADAELWEAARRELASIIQARPVQLHAN